MALKLYLVTLDLLQPHDYASLRNRLQAFAAKQILERQWALRTTLTAAQLKSELRGFIGDQDRIVVAELGAEWASRRAMVNLRDL